MHRELARRAAADNPGSRIYSLDVSSPPPDFLHQGLFDAVALFDVLEHLTEPEEFLRACAALLRHDRASLRALFAKADLPRPRTSYFFQILVPGLLGRRAIIGCGGSEPERR